MMMSLQIIATTTQCYHHFYPQKILETKDNIIINNNTHDHSRNDDADNEGRSINEHKKYYFMHDVNHTGMTYSFKYFLLTS